MKSVAICLEIDEVLIKNRNRKPILINIAVIFDKYENKMHDKKHRYLKSYKKVSNLFIARSALNFAHVLRLLGAKVSTAQPGTFQF